MKKVERKMLPSGVEPELSTLKEGRRRIEYHPPPVGGVITTYHTCYHYTTELFFWLGTCGINWHVYYLGSCKEKKLKKIATVRSRTGAKYVQRGEGGYRPGRISFSAKG